MPTPALAQTPGAPPYLVLLLLGNLAIWGAWYLQTLSVTRLASRLRARLPLLLAPLACLGTLVAAAWVPGQDHWLAEALLAGLGLGLLARLLPLLGVSARDDVVERRNPAAGIVVCGALLGLTLCLALPLAAGEKLPLPPLLRGLGATLCFLGLWMVFEKLAAPHEGVTVGRDTSTGCRLAGFLVSAGLLLGSAFADPNSTPARSPLWPTVAAVLLLLAAAVVVEVRTRRHPGGWARTGLLPALVLFATVSTFVLLAR